MTFRQRPRSDRSLSGPMQDFDLDEELAGLRGEKEWQEGRRNAITLRKGGGLSVVLLAMRVGDRLEEHSAPGPISLVVRRAASSSRPGTRPWRPGRRRCSRVAPGYAMPWKP